MLLSIKLPEFSQEKRTTEKYAKRMLKQCCICFYGNMVDQGR